MNIEEKCNDATKFKEDCNATIYCGLAGKALFGSLSDDDKCLVCLCTKCSLMGRMQKIYISNYENLHCYCCNPWNKHHKQINTSLSHTASTLNLKHAKKLCKHCLECPHKISSSSDEDMDNYGLTEDLDISFNDATFDRSELSSEAKAIAISPISTVSSKDKLSFGKNNLTIKNEIQERVAHSLGIPEQELKTDDQNDDCPVMIWID